MPAATTIGADVCARMVEHAAASCVPPTQAPPAVVATETQANLDALAVAVTSQGSSVSAQATAVSILALVIGIVALIGAVTWGYFVRRWALDLARKTAEEWMGKNAPGLIAEYQAAITAGSGEGPTPEDQARGFSEESA